MCPQLGWTRSQLHHVPHLHINVFFTAHVSSFMTLSEVTFVSLFLSRLENCCTLKYFANAPNSAHCAHASFTDMHG